ncbi:putative Sex-lethal like protein [Blattamonas nauphoetae]|uniref:Sex-lethal like protein n=1 Tax=Blattamonas nauphoetae TaxID=2049346 RepID=A0ABQ9XAW5_9EUKA|nr:putative Sex-lethal like protein [Blattamonas nauphoetae]
MLKPQHQGGDCDECNIFVNYLPQRITDKDLEELFSPFGQILSAKIMVNHLNGASMGFGFVRFSSKESANMAIKKMQNYKIGTKHLLVKHSNSSMKKPVTDPDQIVVRFLPPHANPDYVRNIFSRFGIVQSVHVTPQIKYQPSGPKLAYVHFKSSESAAQAMYEMKDTIPPHGTQPLSIQFTSQQTPQPTTAKDPIRQFSSLSLPPPFQPQMSRPPLLPTNHILETPSHPPPLLVSPRQTRSDSPPMEAVDQLSIHSSIRFEQPISDHSISNLEPVSPQFADGIPEEYAGMVSESILFESPLFSSYEMNPLTPSYSYQSTSNLGHSSFLTPVRTEPICPSQPLLSPPSTKTPLRLFSSNSVQSPERRGHDLGPMMTPLNLHTPNRPSFTPLYHMDPIASRGHPDLVFDQGIDAYEQMLTYGMNHFQSTPQQTKHSAQSSSRFTLSPPDEQYTSSSGFNDDFLDFDRVPESREEQPNPQTTEPSSHNSSIFSEEEHVEPSASFCTSWAPSTNPQKHNYRNRVQNRPSRKQRQPLSPNGLDSLKRFAQTTPPLLNDHGYD